MCSCGARDILCVRRGRVRQHDNRLVGQIYCGSTDWENCDRYMYNGSIGSFWPRKQISARGNRLILQVARGLCSSCLTKKQNISEVLVDEFVSRFGVSLQLHSDKRTKCSLMDIKKTRTTPLHPQSDSMVRRYNQTLKLQLSLFVQDHQRDWDKCVPLLLIAYHIAIHNPTKTSPRALEDWTWHSYSYRANWWTPWLRNRRNLFFLCPGTSKKFGKS